MHTIRRDTRDDTHLSPGMNLVTTGSFRIGLLKILNVHMWEVILITSSPVLNKV
jgi:hypothetical protein